MIEIFYTNTCACISQDKSLYVLLNHVSTVLYICFKARTVKDRKPKRVSLVAAVGKTNKALSYFLTSLSNLLQRNCLTVVLLFREKGSPIEIMCKVRRIGYSMFCVGYGIYTRELRPRVYIS